MADSLEVASGLPEERPSKVRYIVVGMATLMAVLLYLDRFCLSFLVTYISEDFALKDWQSGLLLSAFFWSYALGQVPSGWLTDRFGARLMLTLYIVLWSLFTGLMGVAIGFMSVLVLRLLCGFAQAGAYPTGASMISKWVPFAGRGQASAIVSVGGRMGGVLAPLLTAYLIVGFVPVSVPSELTETDILNSERLGADLLLELDRSEKSPRKELAHAIWEGRPEKYHQPTREQLDEGLLLELFQKAQKRRDLYQKVDPAQFKLSEEALWLLDLPAEQLTEEQRLRLNRLLLEAAFPGGIRKIYGEGWRPVALVYGVVGLLVAGAFWLGVRDRPREHPGCNAAEVNLIEGGRLAGSNPHGQVKGLPWKYLVRSRSLTLSSISQFGTNFGWVFLLSMLPIYLEDAHRIPPLERGQMSSLPVLIGMVGMLTGGWLTDRLTRAIGVRWGRGLPMASTRFLAMGAYLVCLWPAPLWVLLIAFCVVAVATDLGTASVWGFVQDVGGKHVGSVLGWGNMWGNFGAAVSPLVLFSITGEHRWEYRFLACAVAFFVAGIAALGVDARVPIVAEEE